MSKVKEARDLVQAALDVTTATVPGGLPQVAGALTAALIRLDAIEQAVQSAQEVYGDQPDLSKLAEEANNGEISYSEYDSTCFDVWNDAYDTLGVLLGAL